MIRDGIRRYPKTRTCMATSLNSAKKLSRNKLQAFAEVSISLIWGFGFDSVQLLLHLS
jgi:hypothetical protein